MAFSTVLKYGILSQVSESGPPFPSDGLTHYYRFDEESGTATKNQITNNNATANNSRVLGSSGFHNNGADFTQGNDYITSADLKSLGSMMAEPMSFSFWINLTDDNFRVVSVFYGDYLSFNIYIDNNKPTVYFRSSNGNTYACNANYSLSTGQWYLLTFVFDAPERDVKFYVDGDEKTITVIHNTGAPTGFSDFGDDIRIGCRDVRGSYDSFFDAKLDELAVWNRALTEQEITDLYNAGNGLFY